MRELFCTIQMVSCMKSFAALERRSTHLLITPPILYSTANKYYVYIYILFIYLMKSLEGGMNTLCLPSRDKRTLIE